MKQHLMRLLVLVTTLTLIACGGGSSGSDLRTDTCGVIGLNARIINGTPCTEAGSPVVPITLINSNGRRGLCSGTMLTQRDVLTAAHCFLLDDIVSAYVTVNDSRIDAAGVVINSAVRFDPATSAVFNDVAILRLSRRASTAILPLLISEDIGPNDTFAIYGYGLDQYDNFGTLQSGEMRAGAVTADHIIAPFSGSGSNTCSGDSGGPAVKTVNRGGNNLSGIVGITSSGQDAACKEGDVSLFTNLQKDSLRDFILTNAPEAQVL